MKRKARLVARDKGLSVQTARLLALLDDHGLQELRSTFLPARANETREDGSPNPAAAA